MDLLRSPWPDPVFEDKAKEWEQTEQDPRDPIIVTRAYVLYQVGTPSTPVEDKTFQRWIFNTIRLHEYLCLSDIHIYVGLQRVVLIREVVWWLALYIHLMKKDQGENRPPKLYDHLLEKLEEIKPHLRKEEYRVLQKILQEQYEGTYLGPEKYLSIKEELDKHF